MVSVICVCLFTQSYPTLCNPMDCSLAGSVHGILQARILEWVFISFSRESSWLRDQTLVSCVSCIAGGFFTHWAFNPNKRQLFAAAKSLQSCPTLCNPIDGSPPGSPVPGILQARILQWVAISFSNAWNWKVKVKSLSCVWLLATPFPLQMDRPASSLCILQVPSLQST